MPSIKCSGSLNPEFLCCNAPHCSAGVTWSSSHCPVGIGAWVTGMRNADTLTTDISVNNKVVYL